MTCAIRSQKCSDDCADGHYACWACVRSIKRVISSTLRDWPALELVTAKAEHVETSEGHTAYGPSIPVSAHAIDVQLQVKTNLVAWCRDWHESNQSEPWPANTITGLLRWARDSQHWSTHPAVADWAREMSDLAAVVSHAIDLCKPKRIDLGPCPAQDAETAKDCIGHVVGYAPRDSRGPLAAACAQCGATWGMAELFDLGKAVQQRQRREYRPVSSESAA